MSFCTKVSNYCRNTYNACSTQVANAYKAVEIRVFTFPVVGQSAQNLKAALVAMPIFLKQMVRAGSIGSAAQEALRGANVGLGVTVGTATSGRVIPTVGGFFVGATLSDIRRIYRLHPIPTDMQVVSLLGLSVICGSIGWKMYSDGTFSAGVALLDAKVALVICNFVNYRQPQEVLQSVLTGLVAGISSTYLGFTSSESGIVAAVTDAVSSHYFFGTIRNDDWISAIRTGVSAGAAVTGFAVAGPLGAAGAGGAAGACFAPIKNMLDHPEFLNPVTDRFHEERNEIRRSGQQALLTQHRLPIPVARIITEYTE